MVDKSSKDATINGLNKICRSQDMVHVNIDGQLAKKQLIQNISELMLENFCPRLRRNVFVQIDIVNRCEHEAGGYCWGDKDNINIEIPRNSGDHKYTRKEMLINLTHELIHAKQYILGELSSTTSYWKKENHTKTPYSKQPWEREAYYWEQRLYEKYFERLDI